MDAMIDCIRNIVFMRGRINRRTFVLFSVPVFAIAVVVAALTGLSFCAFWLLSVILVPLCVLRLHDVGCSGWGALAALIPGGNVMLFLILAVRKGTPGCNYYSPLESYSDLNAEDGAESFVLEVVRGGGCGCSVRLLLEGRAVCFLRRNRKVSFRLPRKTVSVAVESNKGVIREMLVDPGESQCVRLVFSVCSFRLLYLVVPILMLRPLRVDIIDRQYLSDGERSVCSTPRRLSSLEKREFVGVASSVGGMGWIRSVAVLLVVGELFLLSLPRIAPEFLLNPWWRGILLCASFPGVFYGLFVLLTEFSSKLRRRGVSSEVDESAPYILYLRSFADDDKMSRSVDVCAQYGRTEEEVLMDIFSDIAPVVAIGRPGESNMPFGAHRIYVDDINWKQRVLELANRAKYVVLRLGATENFMWEVDRCLQSVDVSRLLFLIPRGLAGSRVWNALREKMASFDWNEADDEARKIDWFGWRRGSSFGWLRVEGSRVRFKALRKTFNPFSVSYVENQRESLMPVFRAAGSIYNSLFSASETDVRARRWKFVYIVICFLIATGKWMSDWCLPIFDPLRTAVLYETIRSCKDISPAATSIRLVDNVYIPRPCEIANEGDLLLDEWDAEAYSVLKVWGPVTNGLNRSFYTFGRLKCPADICECDLFEKIYLACKNDPQSVCGENVRVADCAPGCVFFYEDVSSRLGCPAVECVSRFMVAGRIVCLSIIRFGHDEVLSSRVLDELRGELERWIASVREESRIAGNREKAIAGDDVRIGHGRIPAPTGCLLVYHFAEIAAALNIDDDDSYGGFWECLAAYVADGWRSPDGEIRQFFRIKEWRRCRCGADSCREFERLLVICKRLTQSSGDARNSYHEVAENVFSQSVKDDSAGKSASAASAVVTETLVKTAGTVLALEVRTAVGEKEDVKSVEAEHCRMLREWRDNIEMSMKHSHAAVGK